MQCGIKDAQGTGSCCQNDWSKCTFEVRWQQRPPLSMQRAFIAVCVYPRLLLQQFVVQDRAKGASHHYIWMTCNICLAQWIGYLRSFKQLTSKMSAKLLNCRFINEVVCHLQMSNLLFRTDHGHQPTLEQR